MRNVTSLTDRDRQNPSAIALDDPAHAAGDIVLVDQGGRSYYARILGTTWNGSYIVDPIAPGHVDEQRAA